MNEENINHIGRVYEPLKVDFIERPIPELEDDQVLIKVRASAICGSDLHIFKGKHPAAPLPVTIGHEFAGDVAKIGKNVGNIAVGDKVTAEPCIVCGECDACRHGEYGYCEHISFTYRNGDGAMADYVVIKAPHVFKLPDYLDYETGALMEPLSVATHAVRRADIRLGETVLIIGAGAIGLMVAAMCRRSGASRIIIAGRSQDKLSIAKQLGATDIVNSSENDPVEAALNLTSGKGVDKSFECVGNEDCFKQAMMGLKRNGTATIVGIYENTDINIPVSRFITHEIHVQGSQGYCWDFPIAIAAAQDIPLEKLITHRFPLNQLQQALETCLDRRSGSIKVLLKP